MTPALILAAGSSSRLGRPKQLVVWRGETLLARISRLALEAGCRPVVVILGSRADACRLALAQSPGVLCLENPAWAEGLASSLRLGLETVLSLPGPRPEGVMVLLTDQPHLTSEHLRKLLQSWTDTGRGLVATVPGSGPAQTPGAPAIIGAKYFPDALNLRGDRAARTLFQRYPDDLATVEFPDAAFEVDTLPDLETLRGEPAP